VLCGVNNTIAPFVDLAEIQVSRYGGNVLRRLQPKPKDRRKVPIPAELRDSLHEVFELIQQAKSDPDIRLDYDDAIQVGAVCGGRIGTKPRPYVLTYYPEGDVERGRWFLTLDRTEIEDIGDGQMAETALYCCNSPECRCKFSEADGHCFFCDYVDDPSYGNFAFPEAETRLAQRGVVGLSETSTRDDVIAVLGPPDESGGGMKHPRGGYTWPWIKYRRPDCHLRFEFNKTGVRIRSITIMEKDWEPGK
jgi:hypothetical protein